MPHAPLETLDLTPGELDIYIRAGDTFTDTWAFTEDDDVTPVDLTGHTFTCQVRRKTDSPEFAAMVVTSAGVAGTVKLILEGTTTAMMSRSYFYDLQSVKDGQVRTWVAGKFYVEGEVTRPELP